MRKAVIMEVRKAEIKDLDIVVQMKMNMFKEVGSVTLLQENAESKIYAKYKELYSQEKCCHYLVYENSKAVAYIGVLKKQNGTSSFITAPPHATALLFSYTR